MMELKKSINDSGKRFEILDIYRGIAIVLVLFRHHEVFPFLNKIGWTGVSLFFVLSGYLISCLLFKELTKHGKLNIKLFYIRRGFKIYPGFYFFIFCSFATLIILYLITGHRADRLYFKNVIVELFFVQNYFHGLWYHTWSIAVEEHFYLIFPIILYLSSYERIRRTKVFFGSAISLILLVLIFRIINFRLNQNFEIYRDTFNTHLRFDGFIFGIIIGYDQFFNESKIKNLVYRYKIITILIMIAFFLPVLLFYMESPINYIFGFTSVSISFALLILLSLDLKYKQFNSPLARLFIFIGTCSYAIYLWQGYIISFVMRGIEEILHINPFGAIDFLLFVIISVLTGWFFTHYLENFFLEIRQRKFPSK